MENYNTEGFSFDLPKGNSSIIKVIGVGGGGNNALKHMYERGIHGVDFVVCNTDAQTLDNNPVANKVQLGITMTEGLGAGADPEVGEKAALESIDEIKASLGQNTKMVFITAGMGGGTGTGAAPVIAKVAKEQGILTVGIVTVPFSFEGKRRLEQAESGLEKLRNNVDSLIVINNDKLRQQFGNLGFKQGFSKADEVLTNAAKGMAEVITGYFDVNIDFRDAKSVLQNSGTALMSTGVASGENKAEEAVKKALDSPLLNDNKITGAKNVLLLIRSGSEEVTMDEIGVIMDHIQKEAGNTADIIFGVGSDEELGDSVSVLVIATGFAKENHKNTGPTEKIKFSLNDSLEDRSRIVETPAAPKAPEVIVETDSEPRSLFRLDDEIVEEKAPNFEVKTPKRENPFDKKMEFKVVEKQEVPVTSTVASTIPQQPELFSFEDDLEAESFSFDLEDDKHEVITEEVKTISNEVSFTEEKPIEFSFFINDKEEETVVFEEKVEEVKEVVEEAPRTFPQPIVAEKPVVEEVKEEVEIHEEFTFISKPTTNVDRSAERRNKLQEFNSRYQVSENANDFETVPAFRRKNISINDSNASDQEIRTFLTENDRGQMQVRENRFLNKDVD